MPLTLPNTTLPAVAFATQTPACMHMDIHAGQPHTDAEHGTAHGFACGGFNDLHNTDRHAQYNAKNLHTKTRSTDLDATHEE